LFKVPVGFGMDHDGWVNDICCLNPSSPILVSASSDGTIKTWDTKELLASSIATTGDDGDAKRPLATFGYQRSCGTVGYCVDCADGGQCQVIGHCDYVKCLSRWQGDSKFFSGGLDGVICFWDATQQVLIRSLTGMSLDSFVFILIL
jgi:WD40 repeat protein